MWSGQTASAEAASSPRPPRFSTSRLDRVMSATGFVSMADSVVEKEIHLVDKRPLQGLRAFGAIFGERRESDVFFRHRGRARQTRQKQFVYHAPIVIRVTRKQPLNATVSLRANAL